MYGGAGNQGTAPRTIEELPETKRPFEPRKENASNFLTSCFKVSIDEARGRARALHGDGLHDGALSQRAGGPLGAEVFGVSQAQEPIPWRPSLKD